MSALRNTWLLAAISFLSCPGGPGPSPDLGGETSTPLGSVGNTVSLIGGIKVGSDTVDVPALMTVTKSEAGLVTAKVTADLTKDPRLSKYNDLIPSSAKDSSGKIDTEVKFRITSEGVQDFFNKDGVQHTLVKYGDSPGATYALTKTNGLTITRKMTARSDADDFPYSGFMIKTVTLEQDSRIPGIKKFIYRANHRFGIVYLELVADDGSSVSTYLKSLNN